jgi:hypothetical protein
VSDEGAPYDKAIEETAKAASNAIDLVREGSRAISPAIGNIYGLLIGDKVSAARDRRLDELARNTKTILHDRDVKERQELPEDIAIPLLEAAQGESREELKQLWARLLANAMDPKRAADVRPEFIETIRSFTPIDATILSFIVGPADRSPPIISDAKISHGLNLRSTAVRTSINHLRKIGCLSVSTILTDASLSDYGIELLIAIAP